MSLVLRMPDPEKRQDARDMFVDDLKRIWRRAEQLAG